MKKDNEKKVAHYLTIEKIVTTEENFTVHTGLTAKELKKGLLDGEFNIIQNNLLEPYVWVVDNEGKRVAHLSKDGGCGPDEKVKVIVD